MICLFHTYTIQEICNMRCGITFFFWFPSSDLTSSASDTETKIKAYSFIGHDSYFPIQLMGMKLILSQYSDLYLRINAMGFCIGKAHSTI